MGTAQQNSRQFPSDLTIEIFSRLPAKSVARFRCLSKLWASLLKLGSPYFTELFLTHSKTRPRLLFAVQRNEDEWCLYSCPQPQISYKNPQPSLSVTAEFYMSPPKSWLLDISTPISGIIYCFNMPSDNSPMLCNPSTRHLLRLPQQPTAKVCSYFGYDPIDKQCSVLSSSYTLPFHGPLRFQILKLGSERLSWRNIECPLDHHPLLCNTCINGVLYYIAHFGIYYPRKIACFDLNSEEFKFIDEPWSQDCEPMLLVNFKGKLGGIDKKWVEFGKNKVNLELSLWVLEDVEKQEWSKHKYLLPSTLWSTKFPHISIVGVTATGEVVLYLFYTTNPLYVYFFNLEKNILQKVEIKGLEEFKIHHFLKGCVDYVEDIKDLNWS